MCCSHLQIAVLDPDQACPSSNLVHKHVVGSFKNRDDVLAFAKECDVITIEIEHVDTDVLEQVETQLGIPVRPAPSTVAIIQDKHRQKLHLRSANIAVADFCDCPTQNDISVAGEKFGYPFVRAGPAWHACVPSADLFFLLSFS